MEQRIGREATPEEAGVLWTAADVLMGLRYPRPLVNDLLRGIHNMKDSVTYQGIVEEGVVKDQQAALLDLGRLKIRAADGSRHHDTERNHRSGAAHPSPSATPRRVFVGRVAHGVLKGGDKEIL